MKRLFFGPLFFLLFSKAGLAQYEGQSGIQLFYQRDQGFDFRSGSAAFDVQSVHLNGGGFGFDYGITDWFALWSQVAFYSGVRQGGISMNLINEIQGMKLTSPGKGPFRVYAKGGVGFTRYIFEFPGFRAVDYGQAFNYGGGLQIKVSGGMSLILEATQLAVSLPNLTGAPGRDKWDASTLFTTGIAFHF